MIDKCPPNDYNCTYTMVEVANVISTAPETAIAAAGKGPSPKDGPPRQKGPFWDDAEHAADCHPADEVHPWGDSIFAPCVYGHGAVFDNEVRL